jgi:hypothetical protein
MSYWHQMYARPSPNPRLEVKNGEARFESLMAKKLSDKDRQFAESLERQFGDGGTLSVKQIECLEKMEQRYSPETVLKRERWAQSYKADHREIAIIAAKYYRTTQYFSDLASNILIDEDFVPTERQFEAITKNKYAKRAIATAIEPPAFPVGTLCKVRANYNLIPQRHLHDQFALIVKNHATGIYPSSTVLINGVTTLLDDRCLKRTTSRGKKNK